MINAISIELKRFRCLFLATCINATIIIAKAQITKHCHKNKGDENRFSTASIIVSLNL